MSAISEPRVVGLLLRRVALRHWRQAPGQSAVLILLLALGVGVFFALRLANRAVLSRLEIFSDLVSQESDWVITSPSGVLPESALREMRSVLAERPVTLLPVLEITAAEPAPPGQEGRRMDGTRRVYSIVGTDLVALANLAGSAATSILGTGSKWSGLEDDRAVYISPALARRAGWQAGDWFSLIVNDRAERLHVAGVLPTTSARGEAPETLLLMDLPAVQKLGQTPGRIDRVECLVEPGAQAARYRAEGRALLEAQAGGRWILSSPGERQESAARMTEALRLNLTLLSSLALLVGFFFIYQALDGAVVRRREEIATLRALGVTEWTLRQAWLAEALLLGLAGGGLGGVLGWVGAQSTVHLVSRTVNALYHTSHVEQAPFLASEFALALLLGAGFSIVAGWLPARDAARTPPAQALRRHAQTVLARGRLWPGAALLALGLAAAFLPPVPVRGGGPVPLGGYLATLAAVLGVAALAGPLLALLARWLRPWGESSALVRLALSQLRQPSLRHAIAAACLLSAVAMAGGMAVLVGSYDHTMRGWLERTFLADLYISSEGSQSASSTNRLPPQTWKAIVADPAVEDFYAVQIARITLPEGPTQVAGGDLGFLSRRIRMSWLHAPGPEVFDPARNGSLALASEAFMRRFRRRVGETVRLPTPAGEQPVRIVGVYADYGNERGTILIERRQFAAWWGHELIATLALQLRPGVDPEAFRARLKEGHRELNIFTNRALREQALRVFRETFAITYALEIIGVAVAVAGLGLTLASIFLQRRADLATLRALGWSPADISRAAAAEGLLLAVSGLAAGLGLSLLLGALLVYVINRQAFGWTLEYHLPWSSLAVLSLMVLASAAATSLALGRWAARLPADHEE